jgi:hypothetical protein
MTIPSSQDFMCKAAFRLQPWKGGTQKPGVQPLALSIGGCDICPPEPEVHRQLVEARRKCFKSLFGGYLDPSSRVGKWRAKPQAPEENALDRMLPAAAAVGAGQRRDQISIE